jgi:hypothetical protein
MMLEVVLPDPCAFRVISASTASLKLSPQVCRRMGIYTFLLKVILLKIAHHPGYGSDKAGRDPVYR